MSVHYKKPVLYILFFFWKNGLQEDYQTNSIIKHVKSRGVQIFRDLKRCCVIHCHHSAVTNLNFTAVSVVWCPSLTAHCLKSKSPNYSYGPRKKISLSCDNSLTDGLVIPKVTSCQKAVNYTIFMFPKKRRCFFLSLLQPKFVPSHNTLPNFRFDVFLFFRGFKIKIPNVFVC